MNDVVTECSKCAASLRGINGYAAKGGDHDGKVYCTLCVASMLRDQQVVKADIQITQIGCSTCGEPRSIHWAMHNLWRDGNNYPCCNDRCARALFEVVK